MFLLCKYMKRILNANWKIETYEDNHFEERWQILPIERIFHRCETRQYTYKVLHAMWQINGSFAHNTKNTETVVLKKQELEGIYTFRYASMKNKYKHERQALTLTF